ncbi:unnamed protein product [Nesidiocoris tenuis]|nr:unnamed protein product [Nesidiocoris tenuis]CAB0002865.1 unnamed protein product [Nesidiocoris tenuis]
MQVSLTGSGASCVASVDHIVLNQLGRISVHTGGGLFHSIENRILDKMSNSYHGTIVNLANSALADAAAKALPGADLCNKIPH